MGETGLLEEDRNAHMVSLCESELYRSLSLILQQKGSRII
jgi:hypothetical protein